jgi:DNA-binding GntR family transcriptional regulator
VEIDFGSDVPLHVQVAALIRAEIDTNVLRPGDELRTEGDLGHHYGVGLGTVRRALAALASEGRIVRRRGYRAQVMPEVEREIVRVQRGSMLRARMPNREERREMGLPVGVPVVEIHYGGRVTLHAGDRCEFKAS